MTNSAPISLAGKKIWVAGHKGMVGSAVMRRLEGEGCALLSVERSVCDLTRQDEVESWMVHNKPDLVFLCAATVGGILANDTRPANFLYENMMIEANIIHAAYKIGVTKLLFLGSSCIYPRLAPQPMREDDLLTGALEPTNQWYAIAKIAGLKLCEAYRRQYGADFISAMPTNLYGPGDNFDRKASHVIPALMRRAHEAKLAHAPHLTIWGTGTPRREFLHVDDLADALVYLMKTYSEDMTINVGSGQEVSIAELARLVSDVVGYQGALDFDTTKPDGTPRKLLDVSRLKERGWTSKTTLHDGLNATYQWFLEHQETYRGLA